MKIGYPCINRGIGCTANSTFRLASYSDDNLREKVSNNLACLMRILEFNVKSGLYFFRISSDIIPFASHPVCAFDWVKGFSGELKSIGDYIKKNGIRISMHPDQFTILNARDRRIHDNSVSELCYHCALLDAMGLDERARVQIHAGGVYGDREGSIKRFISNYTKLDGTVRKRLVVENDDRNYNLKDCLFISAETGVPVLLDVFHHECLNSGERLEEALFAASVTWKKKDGILMVDYSIQKKGARKGTHAESIDLRRFGAFIRKTEDFDFDLMLEIKDKERSALGAVEFLRGIPKASGSLD